MKKILCIFLMAVFLVGCGNTPVKVLEQNGIFIKYQMQYNDDNGITASADEYSCWFDISVGEITNRIIEKAAEKGYEELESIPSSIDTERSLSLNGETCYISMELVDKNSPFVSEVELSLYTDGEERSKINGEYIYVLMDVFSPGMKEDICEVLGIFDDSDSDLPDMRRVLIGNTIYTYIKKDSTSDEFIIHAFAEPEETPKESSAIKPQ